MAITRLKDIVTVFESKWTFGDSKFGYDGEVNESHNTQYPLLLVNPPLSTMPDIYTGREEYEFEINFYNLYPQAAQSAVTLQHRWDNLQDLAMEWFDMVLKNYQDTTKQISAWADQSGNSNSVAQVTSSKQALRYGYDGANDKARIEFNGTSDFFTSITNLAITNHFTIFQVSKTDGTEGELMTYEDSGKFIKLGYSATSQLKASVSDSTTTISVDLAGSDASEYHIGTYKLHNKHLYVDYDTLGSSLSANVQESAYDHNATFNQTTYDIGSNSSIYLGGNIQEFIIYNAVLNDVEIANVKSYLNNKFKIY